LLHLTLIIVMIPYSDDLLHFTVRRYRLFACGNVILHNRFRPVTHICCDSLQWYPFIVITIRRKGSAEEIPNFGFVQPIYSNTRGFIKTDNPTVLVKEMIQIQSIYRKDSGIRIRGEVITISKDVLNPAFSMAQIKTIADRMSSFFFFSGFQCVYGVFDQGNTFRLMFGINSVSFADGHKYHHNNSTVREGQLYALNSIIGEITGAPLANPFDFARLEFY